MTVRDPEWTARDAALAKAWDLEQRLKCGGCGESLIKTTVKSAQFGWIAEPVYCHKCAVLAKEQRKIADAAPGTVDGLYLRAIPRR